MMLDDEATEILSNLAAVRRTVCGTSSPATVSRHGVGTGQPKCL